MVGVASSSLNVNGDQSSLLICSLSLSLVNMAPSQKKAKRSMFITYSEPSTTEASSSTTGYIDHHTQYEKIHGQVVRTDSTVETPPSPVKKRPAAIIQGQGPSRPVHSTNSACHWYDQSAEPLEIWDAGPVDHSEPQPDKTSRDGAEGEQGKKRKRPHAVRSSPLCQLLSSFS